jgi:hypothetical protein
MDPGLQAIMPPKEGRPGQIERRSPPPSPAPPLDPCLAVVTTAWPRLAVPVRAAILALIKTAFAKTPANKVARPGSK